MIQSLRVENYLSLRRVTVAPKEINLMVGPNMSGKSNFVDALRFIHSMASKGLAKTLLDRGGFSEVLWKGVSNSTISIQISAEIKEASNTASKRFNYEIQIVGSLTSFLVQRETLSLKIENTSHTIFGMGNGKTQLKDLKNATVAENTDQTRSALEFDIPGWIGMDFKNWVAGWRFFHLIPQLMKNSVDAKKQDFLHSDGSNLSSWLMTLQTTYKEEFGRMLRITKDVFPQVEDLISPLTESGTTAFSSRETNLKKPVPVQGMSDGEVALLGLLSIFFAPEEKLPSVLSIEEPESHLHPRLIDTLVEVITQRQTELGPRAPQLFLTTHSLHLVDKMKLEDLIVFQRNKGETEVSKPETKEGLKELLEQNEIGLGDLLYSGSLSQP